MTWLMADRMMWPTLALLALGGASVVYFVDPRVTGNYPTCPFLYVTGCYCPGCGTLRALHQAMKGDLREALDYNALAVLSLPVLAATYVGRMARLVSRSRLPDINITPKIAWAALAVIATFWILRNVPYYPLTALAP